MMMMAATVTPVVLKVREEKKNKKKSLPLCTYPPPGSFHPIFLTLSVEKVKKKKKKKWCADSFMAVGECTRRRRMESLVLFFFFLFYCVPTTLLVPPHLSLDISWQGEWLAQKEEVEKRTDLSRFFLLRFSLYYIPANAPAKTPPNHFFFYSPDEKIGLKWHWSDFCFLLPHLKTMADFF